MPSRSQASSLAPDDSLERVVRIGLLMDLYGRLLTERQQNFMRLHFEEDFSFGEIARQFGVSRQAVHDAVKNAEASLEDYESKMQLLDRGVSRAPGSSSSSESFRPSDANPGDNQTAVRTTTDRDILAQALAKLGEVENQLQRSGGIIYNVEGLRVDITAVRDLLTQAVESSRDDEEPTT